LERAYPAEFARPEVALNLIAQQNVTENHLTINITAQEAESIESQAGPVRAKVAEMFKAYRPSELGNGNGHSAESAKKVIDVESERVPERPITRQPGEENSAVLW
jgi:hypothetical protein